MYVDIKGKIERGERLKTITTEELIKLWLDKQQRIVTEAFSDDLFKIAAENVIGHSD